MMGGLNDKEINQTYISCYVMLIWSNFTLQVLSQMPYFRRSGGRDHIFVFSSGAGAHLFRSWATYINQGFNKLKDLIGGARCLECPELKFSGPKKFGRIDYFEHLRDAKFCLAPRGESSWTLRFYEAFFVVLELPFQNVVDYTQISIKRPSTRIGPELLQYLESIPDEYIEGMISRGRQVRCLWTYASESASCSAMHAILWELQRKVRLFHQSSETFWLHNGTVVNRNLVEFSEWRLPMPLP
ncbi:beta-1,4-xylosyltransferase IRX10 [Pyrus ussuriensis x Pyrus communis]|uniref:Beta-1,4-xylosyltransferase IRX10 n=1 Tax=Pyrus ussuriensis x Pyrus communis TaxID=2448454 RepID=A0A5N5I4P1_9ROSA|nr:beta-1,4-xylosyltransferase IRX10 [Pyrus ussuriensis x Pyrus communis]